MSIYQTIKEVIRFISDDIWKKGDNEYESRSLRWFARQLKVFIFTVRSYGQDQLVIRSAALTFYTLMSLVPLAAIIFGIAKGFMFESTISDYLYVQFPQYTPLIDQIIVFANALLERTKGGVLAVIGFVLLLWAVMKVFINIEGSFNHIWDVKKSRSITRKVSDYLSVLLAAPIFFLVSSNATDYVGDYITGFSDNVIYVGVVHFLGAIIPYFVVWVMFAVVYFVMPNTKVRLGAAVKAALIAGTVFHLFQVLYVMFQSSLSSYNAIYGSFAALPLFLIWMQISWQIILFGAELSFGYQNIEKYVFERESYDVNYDYRRKVFLVVMHRIANAFTRGEQPLDSEKLAKELNLPVRTVRDALFDLEKAGLVVSVDDDMQKISRYLPSRDMTGVRIYDVIREVERAGLGGLSMEKCPDLNSLDTALEKIDQAIDRSKANILLSEIDSQEACDNES